ncbi:TRAPP trafficking subunit Trs65-domain-containing protein [Boletus coccyginus]|nr:TRAPP trafficking subunit Trs65-domain-containing protein [Boletus coccyginus]
MTSGESLESLFGSCVLEVFTPDTSISFPEDVVVDDWLTSVKEPHAERKQVFFDEKLNLLFVMYIKHPSFNNACDRHNPPWSLVELLSHVQVSLEATYISQTPNQDVPNTTSLVPPRTSSMPKGRPPSFHPSIFPPNTPNPIPSTTESDRKYVQSEGTLLFSGIWGTRKATEESKEKFALLFSETQGIWIAVYELSLIVSYLRLPFSNPLLCLTASATLRDKALSLSQTVHPLVAYLVHTEDEENEDTGFEEINLLEGLSLGSSISSDELLHLPSTRLGNTTRQRLFSLPPAAAPTRTPLSTLKQTPNHILRKSYRKILQTVSGFRVRMRTVFVPHVLFPKNSSTSNGDQDAYIRDDFESGNEEREAGNSERTVVLCIEVENSGESGPAMGFSLERLDVKVGREDVTTRLIGWGERAFDSVTENHLFPLLIGSMEQYNLLYVVSFWGTPNDQENLLLTGQGINGGGELQRAVTITVYGRPCLTGKVKDESNILSYPTPTFSSRWNCVLDLSSRPVEEPVHLHETFVGRSALPEPPSPFPGRTTFSSLSSSYASTTPIPQAIAGKRHTLPGSITATRAINPSANSRLSLPSREHPGGFAALPAPTTISTPPSVALQAFNRSVPTTFGMASLPPSPAGGFNVNVSPPEMLAQTFVTPPTPAYPAFPPGMIPNTPHIQALGGQQGYSGPSIEIKRERGMGIMAGVPQTPLPTVSNTRFDSRQEPQPVPSGEPIVVSVGLLPADSGDSYPIGQRKIYPSEQFTLDIFVYNQSSWTRRFEVSYPNTDRRQRKTEQSKPTPGSKGKGVLEGFKASIAPPGILPLQNRVRIGPLKPSTCQSVRMDFLAISPGVHSVDILTLTDVETGFRSAMDIVVHERTIEKEEGS